MYCSKCGNLINQGESFCNKCGSPIASNSNYNNINPTHQLFNQVQNNQGFNNSMNQEMQQNVNFYQPMYNQTKKTKKNKVVKILAIIGGIAVGFIILCVLLFSIVFANSKKLVCKSDQGNITIMYNDKALTGYSAVGITYDLDGQKEVAERIGIDAYLKEFATWFKNNTTGSCTIDGNEVLTDNTENKNEDIQEGKRVGSNEFGYITIPENWANFVDVDDNSTLQYSYANIYIATLYAVPTTQIDSYTYASNIMNKLKNDGVQNVQGATVNVGKYTAYQVYGYYSNENIWLVCWFFEAEDGKTHYISVEGPDRNSEYFNIPNSFSLNE